MNDVWLLSIASIAAGVLVWLYGYCIALLHKTVCPEDVYTPLGGSIIAMIGTLFGLVIFLPWQAAAIPFMVGGTMCTGIVVLCLTVLCKAWTE